MNNTNNLSRENRMPLLCFNIHTIQACLELNYVNKGILLPAIKPVPESPEYLIGLINMAGISVPIIDLAFCLGLGRNTPYSLNMPILLCNRDIKTIGMVVDKVLGLEIVSKESLQLQEDFQQKHSWFKANVLINNEIILLIDMDKIFDTTLLREKK